MALSGCGGSSDRSSSAPTASNNNSAPNNNQSDNRAPIANNDNVTIEIDGNNVIDVLSNDSDPDGDPIGIVLLGAPAHGDISIDEAGTPAFAGDDRIVYQPDSGFTGADLFTYTISDGQNGRANGFVSVMVSNGASSGGPTQTNTSPIAVSDQASTQQPSTSSIAVLNNDIDGDGDTLSLFSFSAPAHGAVARDDNDTPDDTSDDQLTYTPNTGFSGNDAFAYTVTDGQDVSAGLVNVMVSAPASPPVSNEQVCGVVMIGPVSGAEVTLYEVDANGLSGSVPLARVNTGSDGRWCTQVPAVREHLLVQARGGAFLDPSDSRYEDGNARLISLLQNYTLETVLPKDEVFSALTVFSNAILLKSRIETEGNNFVSVFDGNRAQSLQAFGFDLFTTPVGDPVFANPGESQIARQYAMAVGAAVESLNQIAVDLEVPAPNYILIDALIRDLSECRLNGNEAAGPISVFVEGQSRLISDNININTQILRFRNNWANVYEGIPLLQVDQPTCQSIVASSDDFPPTLSSVPSNLRVVAALGEPVPLSDALIQQFLNAPLANDDRDGIVSVTTTLSDGSPLPTVFPFGTTSVVFGAVDSAGNEAVEVIRLIEIAQGGPPQAFPDRQTVDEDTSTTIEVLANDVGLENVIDPSTVTIVAAPISGSATVDMMTGQIIYTPNSEFSGADFIQYTVADVGGRVSAATAVRIGVIPVNDAPIVRDDVAFTEQAASVNVVILANDSDVDSILDIGSINIIEQPVNGSIVVDFNNGVVIYSPNPGFTGNDSFTYTLADLERRVSNIANVEIEVLPLTIMPNASPVAENDLVYTLEDMDTIVSPLVNDSDSDGQVDPMTVTIVEAPDNGQILLIQANGELIYRPHPNYFGNDRFTYVVSDDDGATSQPAVVNISVAPQEDAPYALDDFVSLSENTTVAVSVLDNDGDADGLAGATLSLVSLPLGGTAVWNTQLLRLEYTPNNGFSGPDTASYQLVDASGLVSNVANISFYVMSDNVTPIAVPDVQVTDEDNAVTIDVLDNDLEAQDSIDPSTVNIVGAPSNGDGAVDMITGHITYTPDANFNGDDVLYYTVADASGVRSNIAMVSIRINPVSDVPSLVDDELTIGEDPAAPVGISVLANDFDPDNDIDVTSVRIVDAPSNGMATPDVVTGMIAYQPHLNYAGVDTFTYQVDDAMGLTSNIATVMVTVTSVEDAPQGAPDFVTTSEDVDVSINVLINDFDGDGNIDPTSVTIVRAANKGSTNVDAMSGEVIYTPNQDEYGTDSFEYTVADTAGLVSDPVVVSIDIIDMADDPVANADVLVVDEDAANVVVNVLINDNDSDDDIDVSSVDVVTAPTFGSHSVDALSGAVIYSPNPNYFGTDFFEYRIRDHAGAWSNIARVDIVINAINDDAPIANADNADVNENNTIVIDVLQNDSDPDAPANDIDSSTVMVSVLPGQGGVSVDATTGAITYTPNIDFFGQDAFEYTVRDTAGLLSSSAIVVVTVIKVNEAPQANGDDTGIIFSGESYTFDPALFTSDNDGVVDITTVNAGNENTGTTSVDTVTGVITFTPNPTFTGIGTFQYTVDDNDGDTSNVAEVSVIVWPAEDPDMDGVSTDIELDVGTDPNNVTSEYVYIDIDTPTSSPDGSSWELAFPTVEAAEDFGALESDGSNVKYVLIANNSQLTNALDNWMFSSSGDCTDLIFVGSLDPYVATPQTNPKGHPVTSLQTDLFGSRVIDLNNCDNVQFRHLSIEGGNNVDRGAGMLIRDSEVVLDSVRVSKNRSTVSGAGIDIENISATTTLTMTNSRIDRNTIDAVSDGRALGAGIAMRNVDSVNIIESKILYNRVNVFSNVAGVNGGGGIYTFQTGLYVSETAISANISEDEAGGVFVDGVNNLRLEHSIVSGNEAVNNAGGTLLLNTDANVTLFNNLYTTNFSGLNGGGGRIDNGNGAVLRNNTLAYNVAGDDGGGISVTGSSANLDCNIAAHNSAATFGDNVGGSLGNLLSLDAENNIVDFGIPLVIGTNNISSDPRFVHGYYLNQGFSPGVDLCPEPANDPLFGLADRYTDYSGAGFDIGNLDAGYHYAEPTFVFLQALDVDTPNDLARGQSKRRIVITPFVNGQPMGPGHRIVVDPTTSGASISAYFTTNTLIDPANTGDSVQATDIGDGEYMFLLDTPFFTNSVRVALRLNDHSGVYGYFFVNY